MEFVLILCLSMCVLVMSSWCIFSANCAKGSCGSSVIDLWFEIFYRAILDDCVSSALTNASIISALRTSGALLTYAFRLICSILSASVFICSPEARNMLFNNSFACVCDGWLSYVFWNSGQNSCQVFFISSGKFEYHCCAGQLGPFLSWQFVS